MEEKKPIFGKDVSNVIPGELIVQLHEDAAAQVAASIPRGPSRGRRTEAPAAFGIQSLDGVLGKIKATSVTRLHPPAPPVAEAVEALEHAVSMASTFRIT